MTAAIQEMNNLHDDMIHDLAMDYYSRRLATCSSDTTVKVFEVDGTNHRCLETLRGHNGPVWEVSWAHPKFGVILASAGYDGKVIVWTERNGVWSLLTEFPDHTASVNSVAWSPHELGAHLAAASSDGDISINELNDDGTWTKTKFPAHVGGVNSVSWAPPTLAGSAMAPGQLIVGGAGLHRRLVSGGCDNLVKIWVYNPETKQYDLENTLEGHSAWVRNVAWAPGVGVSGTTRQYIASASEDKTVRIWTTKNGGDTAGEWECKVINFDVIMWSVNWSLSGNVLAAAGQDNKISLWKENLMGEWEREGTFEE
ncbi:protein transport protein sec13 [Ascobolus immersus RN42]|uniref:Protein transport protein SEC13 n=1 Tax=Ascobolus immersus RN42 TaxID=1160509 RepID=A0A3N4IC26_ASCIM|nr:protein transport protein sec13 [Ascobolus immersus RN42]